MILITLTMTADPIQQFLRRCLQTADPLQQFFLSTDPLQQLLLRTDPLQQLLLRTDPLQQFLLRTDPLQQLLLRTDPLHQLLKRRLEKILHLTEAQRGCGTHGLQSLRIRVSERCESEDCFRLRTFIFR